MISAEKYQEIDDVKLKQSVYMKHLVVENPDDFSDILTLCDDDVISEIDDKEYSELVSRHKEETCYDLEMNTYGLTAKIDLSRRDLVFFSISHNKGRKAYIDGAETEIFKVNNGMVGIIVPEGQHEIEFCYTVRGFSEGVIIFVFSAIALTAYIIFSIRKDKKKCL